MRKRHLLVFTLRQERFPLVGPHNAAKVLSIFENTRSFILKKLVIAMGMLLL